MTKPEVRYVHPQVSIPMELWDALCLYAEVTKQPPGTVISGLVADFLINDWEDLVIAAAHERAAGARHSARAYLDSQSS